MAKHRLVDRRPGSTHGVLMSPGGHPYWIDPQLIHKLASDCLIQIAIIAPSGSRATSTSRAVRGSCVTFTGMLQVLVSVAVKPRAVTSLSSILSATVSPAASTSKAGPDPSVLKAIGASQAPLR